MAQHSTEQHSTAACLPNLALALSHIHVDQLGALQAGQKTKWHDRQGTPVGQQAATVSKNCVAATHLQAAASPCKLEAQAASQASRCQ